MVVVQDLFSKCTELASIGTATAINFTNKLKDVLLRYGVPEVIITDNGTQFVLNLFKSLAETWGIRQQTMAPNSP